MDKVTKETIEQLEQQIAEARKTQNAALIRSVTEQWHKECSRLDKPWPRLRVTAVLGDGGLEIDVSPATRLDRSLTASLIDTIVDIQQELNDYVEILDNDFADFIIE